MLMVGRSYHDNRCYKENLACTAEFGVIVRGSTGSVLAQRRPVSDELRGRATLRQAPIFTSVSLTLVEQQVNPSFEGHGWDE